MHVLRVNAARVQTPLMIKIVFSPDAFPADHLLLRTSWNSCGHRENWPGELARFMAKICPIAFDSGSPQDFELYRARRFGFCGSCSASSRVAGSQARYL